MKTPGTIILLLLALNSSFAQEDVHGKWKPKPVLIDGLPTEWNNPLRLYDSGTGLFFDIENDSTTLILCFECKDEPTQIKINKAGMTVGIKSKGKIKCDASINFPLAGRKEVIADEQSLPGKSRHEENLTKGFVLQNVDFLAKGFTSQNGTIPVKDTSGIRLALNWDNKDVMTYEISIPLKELFGEGFSLKDLTKALILKVEINAFARVVSKSPEDSPASSSGGMGGGGAMGGGGIGGGMGGGGMGGGGRGGGGMGGGRGGGGGRHGGGGGGRSSQSSAAADAKFDANKLKQGFFLAQER